MDTKQFAEMLSSGNGALPAVNIADIGEVSRSIKSLGAMMTAKAAGDVKVVKALDSITARLEKLEKKITVQNVYAPDKVTIKNQPDWSGELREIRDAVNMLSTAIMKKHEEKAEMKVEYREEPEEKEDEGYDLKCYRVSDTVEPVTGFQYFGFVAPDGRWYILYNDANEGTLRYKFGENNYSSAWENYDKHDYKRLNEALNDTLQS